MFKSDGPQSIFRYLRRRSKAMIGRLHRDMAGATTLEWTLLLGAIVLPSYIIIRIALAALIAHYQMVVMINSLPFP